MVFRMCSVGGKIYEGDEDENTMDTQLREKPADALADSSMAATDIDEIPLVTMSSNGHIPPSDSNSSYPPLNPNVPHFKDSQLTEDIQNSASSGSHGRFLNAFMTTLALCHTAIASVNDDDGSISYKAQSPDESALVQAAADAGFMFLGKEKDILKLKTPFSEGDSVEEYELLHVLDFTSARKRMSVIVRKLGADDGSRKVFLMSKGADSVIIERLKAGQDALIKTTDEHLEYFASSGKRAFALPDGCSPTFQQACALSASLTRLSRVSTVVSSYLIAHLYPEEAYEEWSYRYHEATVSLDNREEEIEKASDEMERGLKLLGATAIEDKLQDGVPETIADLKRAGIKIWVATGDKLETAICEQLFFNLKKKKIAASKLYSPMHHSHWIQHQPDRSGLQRHRSSWRRIWQ